MNVFVWPSTRINDFEPVHGTGWELVYQMFIHVRTDKFFRFLETIYIRCGKRFFVFGEAARCTCFSQMSLFSIFPLIESRGQLCVHSSLISGGHEYIRTLFVFLKAQLQSSWLILEETLAFLGTYPPQQPSLLDVLTMNRQPRKIYHTEGHFLSSLPEATNITRIHCQFITRFFQKNCFNVSVFVL